MFVSSVNYHFQVSENEEMKNGTADVTQDNDYSIAIVTNQLQDDHSYQYGDKRITIYQLTHQQNIF